MNEFSVIVAMDDANGIGKSGKLPWHLPKDLTHFKGITSRTSSDDKQNAVIMGRKTWDSIPENFRPLKDRINVVLTRNESLVLPTGVVKARDFNDALKLLNQPPYEAQVDQVFVIGGAQIYKEAITRSECSKLFVTQILQKFDCDTFFPPFKVEFKRSNLSNPYQENGVTYYFTEYQRAQK